MSAAIAAIAQQVTRSYDSHLTSDISLYIPDGTVLIPVPAPPPAAPTYQKQWIFTCRNKEQHEQP